MLYSKCNNEGETYEVKYCINHKKEYRHDNQPKKMYIVNSGKCFSEFSKKKHFTQYTNWYFFIIFAL